MYVTSRHNIEMIQNKKGTKNYKKRGENIQSIYFFA